MNCYYCEKPARAICRFCGAAVCPDHTRANRFVSGWAAEAVRTTSWFSMRSGAAVARSSRCTWPSEAWLSRIEIPPDARDHGHEHRTLGEAFPVQSTLGEVANRSLPRADGTDSRQPRHGVSHGRARLHLLEDPRRIGETGSVTDGESTGTIDHRAVLDVEVVGQDRRPHKSRFDADAEIPFPNRGLGAVHRTVERLLVERLVRDLGLDAQTTDPGGERESPEDVLYGTDFHRVTRAHEHLQWCEAFAAAVNQALADAPRGDWKAVLREDHRDRSNAESSQALCHPRFIQGHGNRLAFGGDD